MRLSAELHRILLKRITEALEKAKYYPKTVGGRDGPRRVAIEVLKPYCPVTVKPLIALPDDYDPAGCVKRGDE